MKQPSSLHPQASFADSPLAELAKLVGIELEYINAEMKSVAIAPEVVYAVLEAMNFHVASAAGAQNLISELTRKEEARRLLPVMVVREDDQPVKIPLRFDSAETSLAWRVLLEDGVAIQGVAEKSSLERAGSPASGDFDRRFLAIGQHLPLGYHQLEIDGLNARMRLIVVPPRCWLPQALECGAKVWGLAAQLYLIRSESNWGIGDFSDLRKLIELASGWGSDLVGLNPLHAMFLDDPSQISPYSPASRLFLNINNIDVTAISEFSGTAEMQAMVNSRPFSEVLEKVRSAELLDYENVSKLKLDALRILFRAFQHTADSNRRRDFIAFVRDHNPALKQFCVFQILRTEHAARDIAAADWRQWPEPFRTPDSPVVEQYAADHSGEVEFLSWTQWIAEVQLAQAEETARRCGMAIGLYRDLAVGANAAGYAAWAHPSTVVSKAHAGAPPDILNTTGQDWGLPPFDPGVLRETGYAAFIDLIRANMRHAGALRIDHVVGLQHLYWVPQGKPPSAGAYVAYPFEDLAGILALESWRHQCIVIGEDLGTVPAGFRERAEELGILSYKVVYFEQDPESGEFLQPSDYPALALATVGSHDLATLSGWFAASDIELREARQLYSNPDEAERQRRRREEEKRNLLEALERQGLDPGDGSDDGRLSRAVHAYLGRSGAAIAMVQIENLTGEKLQVNLPGTTGQYPNWQRRLKLSLEMMAENPEVKTLVNLMFAARRETKPNSANLK